MFTVSVETRFWASHQLTLPDGSKEPVHRHIWAVTTDVSSEELNNRAVVIDFHQLRAMVDDIIAEFGNLPLESFDYFRQNSSSAETIAKYIYEKLQTKLPESVKIESIKVVEEPGCSAKFTGDPANK